MMEKIKKVGLNGKIALAFAFFILGATTFASFVNAGFDPTKINWLNWATDVGINEMICFAMMFPGEIFCTSYTTTNANGLYQRELAKYDEAYDKAKDNVQYFGQYLNIRHDTELKTADYNYLVANRIDNPNAVLLLDQQEVKELAKPYSKEINGETVNFKSYNRRQRRIIKFVLSGKVVVTKVPKSYYLDKFNNESSESEYRQAGHINQDIKLARGAGRTFKGVSMALFSALVAGLTISTLNDPGSVETWVTLVSRLVAGIGGFYAGWNNSAYVNKILCRSLALKTNMLIAFRLFMEGHQGYFSMTDEEAEAMEAVNKYQRKGDELWVK